MLRGRRLPSRARAYQALADEALARRLDVAAADGEAHRAGGDEVHTVHLVLEIRDCRVNWLLVTNDDVALVRGEQLERAVVEMVKDELRAAVSSLGRPPDTFCAAVAALDSTPPVATRIAMSARRRRAGLEAHVRKARGGPIQQHPGLPVQMTIEECD